MSKPSRRPKREAHKEQRRVKKKAWNTLRKRQREQGLEPLPRHSVSNSKCKDETVDEEQLTRQTVIEAQVAVIRSQLPSLLKQLAKIPDPRNPALIKHKITVVMLYGILMFVLQMESRRAANKTISMPQFLKNLQLLFPELESLPHNDTLQRLLARIDVEEIQGILMELVSQLIRKKKFRNYLSKKGYLIAIDGTQKFRRDIPWCDEALPKQTGKRDEDGERRIQYSAYVVEANIVFNNAFTIPLATEFLEYVIDEGEDETQKEKRKQDCELRAFSRLVAKIKSYFPRLAITVLLDGLYPNGPVFALCRKNNWDFMIVLKDKSLPTIWEEAEGLRKLDVKNENTLEHTWGERRQTFWWTNGIEYSYGVNGRNRQIVHLVVCIETWEEIGENNQIVQKKSKHAWISGSPLTRGNVISRCNECARYRWGIEANILIEKKQGYQSEHCFSLDWDAMKGYHYLMRIGHMLNALAHRTRVLGEKILELGVKQLRELIVGTLSGPWLDADRVRVLVSRNPQLRLE